MMTAIRNWWTGLSDRERVLVGIAAALAAGVLLWLATFGVWAALSEARAAHGAAVDRAAAIDVRVDAIKALEAAGSRDAAGATASAATLDLYVAQSAAERGLTLARNDPQGAASTNIAISNVRAPDALAWLTALEEAHVLAADLSLRPNADGTVALTATLRRPS